MWDNIYSLNIAPEKKRIVYLKLVNWYTMDLVYDVLGICDNLVLGITFPILQWKLDFKKAAL